MTTGTLAEGMTSDEPRLFRKLTIPASEEYEAPREMVLVAERRTAHLQGFAFHVTLARLLANAYMQGMNDAVDAQYALIAGASE